MIKLNYRLKIGLFILVVFTLGSLILPSLAQEDASAQNTYMRGLPMSREHLLGTNSLGQDIAWYLVLAIRNSLLLGVSVSLLQ